MNRPSADGPRHMYLPFLKGGFKLPGPDGLPAYSQVHTRLGQNPGECVPPTAAATLPDDPDLFVWKVKVFEPPGFATFTTCLAATPSPATMIWRKVSKEQAGSRGWLPPPRQVL